MSAHALPVSYASPVPHLPVGSLACAGWFGALPELMKERQVAEVIRLSPLTLQGWRQTGSGPVFERIGRNIRYPRTALLGWISESRVTTEDEYEIEALAPSIMLTETEAGDQLGFEGQTLRDWRWRRRGPAFFRLGSDTIRYALTDLLAYRSARRFANTSQYS